MIYMNINNDWQKQSPDWGTNKNKPTKNKIKL